MTMPLRPRLASRQGTILIIMAGLSAILAGLAVAFIARCRSDAEETRAMVSEVQARLMLVAACNYIQECSRIGWDRYPRLPGDAQPIPALPIERNDLFPGNSGGQLVNVHEETFGWIDVRDGSIGPKPLVEKTFDQSYPNLGTLKDWSGTARRCWPALEGIARCPMHLHKRPRYATALTVCYNPINTNQASQVNNDYLMPYLRNPDPRPVKNGQTWTDFVTGDPTLVQHTTNKAWFRVLREGPSTFLITCGAGGTQGFHNYDEAVNQGQAGQFNNDPGFFANLATQEVRTWYRVEWSASSAEGTYHWQNHHTQGDVDSYFQWAVNASHTWTYGCRSPSFDRNMGGTFRWIMRLRVEPTNW